MALLDIEPLRAAAQSEIEAGLLACQLAVGRDGEIAWMESFGAISPGTRFSVRSATKPIVASALWHLLADGRLELLRPVAHYLPEFAENGKGRVTVEQVLVMTAGLPNAPMSAEEGGDPARRRARMASWQLESVPGTRYAYHGTSAHWAIAELIERITGQDFRDFVEERVTRPLGLPRVLGIPRDQQTDVAQLELGTEPAADLAAVLEVGQPGGGGVMRAADLARFYQIGRAHV